MEGTTEQDVQYLKQAMLAIAEAQQMMLVKLVEVAEHTNEHHDVINQLGRIVTTLEELVIGPEGGTDEPTT